MKKNVATYRLNRDTTARKALFKGLMAALVEREEIETTQAKAMAVRPLFEKLLTQAKANTLSARREVQSVLQNSKLVKKVFEEIVPKYQDVKGGYTRVVRIKARKGDGAFIVRLSLTKKTVQKETVKETSTETTKPKARSQTNRVVAPRVEKVNVQRVAQRKAGSRGGDR